jgi:tetratricopeptide (TPR) repeat protein/predicted nucleotidyltransferase
MSTSCSAFVARLTLLVAIALAACSRGADPEAAAAHRATALAAFTRGDLATAQRDFAAATDAARDDRDAWFGLGAAALAGDDAARAIGAFEQFLALVPDDPAAEAGLGLALLRAGRGRDGIERLAAAVDRQPDPELESRLAAARAGAELPRELPRAILERVARIDPDARRAAVAAYEIRGLSLIRDGRYADAERAYAAAVRLDEKAATSQLGLGAAALRGSRDLERSRAAIEAYRRLEPDTAAGDFLLAVILRREDVYRNGELAAQHLARAAERAPRDQAIAFYLADTLREIEKETAQDRGSLAQFERSLELNPWCPSTHYALAGALRRRGDEAGATLHDQEFDRLTTPPNDRRFPTKQSSDEWSPILEERLAQIDRDGLIAGAGEAAPIEPKLVRAPMPLASGVAGGTAFDVDADCDLDLVLAGAGILLQHDGAFAKASLPGAAPIAASRASEIHAVDFDNDGHGDLLLAGGDSLVLLRGRPASEGGGFADAMAETGLPSIAAASAVPFDYDHEGDVDLLLVVATETGQELRLLDNALPPRVPPRAGDPEPVATRLSFRDATQGSGIAAAGTALAVAFADVDNGNDTDLVVLARDGDSRYFGNVRNGRFRDASQASAVEGLPGSSPVLEDFDADGFPDLAFVASDGLVHLARNRGDGTFDRALPLPLAGRANAILAFDLDNDGALDLAVAGEHGLGLLRNRNGELRDESVAAGLAAGAAVARLIAIDADSDGDDDLVAIEADGNAWLHRNDGGDRNHRLVIRLEGDLGNRFGIGAKIEIADGAFFTRREVRSFPVTLGIGARQRVASLFVLWTNGVRQPFRDVTLDDPSWMKSTDWNRAAPMVEVESRCDGLLIRQIVRVEGSCPLLYACDGERFSYVTDALCSAVLGLDVGGGQRATPNPDDFVRVRSDQLAPTKDGEYVLALTEELREMTYLDEVGLLVIDHPADVEVHTDNAFTFPPFPEFELHVARGLRPIARAIDHLGEDVTSRLAAIDREYVDTFRRAAPPMQGMAEMHSLEIDLGDCRGAESIRLFLDGWFNWTNSSVNRALAQDGSWRFTPPMLEVADGAGGWLPRGMAGIPAGDHKTVIVDLSGAFRSDDHRVRLTTNLQIYYDRARVAVDAAEDVPLAISEAKLLRAELQERGYSEPVFPDDREPNDYAYHDVVADGSTFRRYYGVIPGRYTRFGDVRELVTAVDDRFVVMHHGEQCVLAFDAKEFPAPAAGMARTFVFRSTGYAKDMDHHTAASRTAGPMPFRAMTGYPPEAGDAPADPAAIAAYEAEWNTRVIPPEPLTAAPRRMPLPPEASAPHVVFTDVTRQAGVRVAHAEGRDLRDLEQTMGSGAAFGDVDGDGDDDLFVVAGRGPDPGSVSSYHHHRLFRNEGDGSFTDLTLESGVGAAGSGMAALFADLDGDGDQDLFVTEIGSNRLYRNDGGFRFTDVTFGSGTGLDGYHSGVAAGDYDRDGDLDLYVARYVTIDPQNRPQEAAGFRRGFVRDDPPSILPMTYPPAGNTLLRNDGGLRFTDVTEAAGVADPEGRTLGVLFADFDLDGRLDLFCANDVSLNSFFRNRGDGTFEALAFDVGLDDPRGGMGVALADLEGDGDLDLGVTYWQLEPNGLYRNNVIREAQRRTRIPTFEEITHKVGFGAPSIGKVGWGISLQDVDGDGLLDAFVVNGYTSPDYETTTLCVEQPPLLFLGQPGGAFRDVTSSAHGAFFAGTYNARGLAASDVDRDGDLDYFVTQNNGDSILLRNDGGSRRSWLQVELEGDGRSVPRDPAGARVVVEAAGVRQTRVLLLGSSYLNGETKVLQFGLGDHDRYDKLIVHWPDGATTELEGGPARRRIAVAR